MGGAEATRWSAVAAALASGILAAACVGNMPSALPLLQGELQLTLFASSWLVSMFNLIGLGLAMTFGLAADRIGADRLCLLGLAGLALGGLAGAAAGSSAVLLASRVVEGAGFVAVAVSAPALIAAATAPGERGLTLGIWSSYLPVGASLALACSPLLLAGIGWRGEWTAIAILTLAGMLWVARLRHRYDGVRGGARRSFADIRGALKQPVPWLLGIAFAAYTTQFYIVVVWLPTYLVSVRGAGLTQSALVTAVVVAANVAGTFYGGHLLHRHVPRGRMLIGGFLAIGFTTSGIFAPFLADGGRLAATIAYSAVAGVIPAAVLSASARYARSPAEAGTIQGLIVQISNLGTFLGPPLSAAVVTWTGRWESAFGVLLLCTAIGLALGAVILRYERQRT
jgi:MFS family permease